MSRGHQPGHVVYSGGKAYYINSAGEYVPHCPVKHRARVERSRWARKLPVDRREMVL